MVQLDAEATITVIYQICDGTSLKTVSPGGRWAITADLRLIDLHSGTIAPLDNANVSRMNVWKDSRWLSEDQVLLTITPPEADGPPTRALLVRCQLPTNTCERATQALSVPLNQQDIGLP